MMVVFLIKWNCLVTTIYHNILLEIQQTILIEIQVIFTKVFLLNTIQHHIS